MAEQWFYTREGKQMDPISAAELKELAAHGGLQPDDLVWKEGLPRWLPASSVKGLFPPRPSSEEAIQAQVPVLSLARELPEEDLADRPRRRRHLDEEFDEEDEDRPRRRRPRRASGLSTGALIAIIGGVGVLLLLGLVLGVYLALGTTGLPAEYSVRLENNTFEARYFTFQAGVPAEITVRSDRPGDVDVRVYDRNNLMVALDESIGPHSFLVFLPPQTGNYKVEIRNLGPGANNSQVKIRELPAGQLPAAKAQPLIPPVANRPVPPVAPPVVNLPGMNQQPTLQIEGTLNQNCAKDQFTKGFCNVHPYNMTAGRTYVIDLESKQFDAFLRLEDQGGKQLLMDDDGGVGLNARLVITARQNGIYRIIATSLGPNQIGRYTLKIRGP